MRDAASMTPLMWAAFHGKPENIRMLKEYGAGNEYIVCYCIPNPRCTLVTDDIRSITF